MKRPPKWPEDNPVRWEAAAHAVENWVKLNDYADYLEKQLGIEKEMTLTPAYGRDYKSKKAVLEDFEAGKDFVIADITSPWNGSYANKSQLKDNGVTSVTIRYKKLQQVLVHKIK